MDCGTLTTATRCPTCDNRNQNTRWGNNYRRLVPTVLKRDGHRCQLQLPGCTTTATTADHTDPNGPRANLSNLQAACAHCNSAKRDRTSGEMTR